jgi:hypothetical protein
MVLLMKWVVIASRLSQGREAWAATVPKIE